jgi:hypothetical protein
MASFALQLIAESFVRWPDAYDLGSDLRKTVESDYYVSDLEIFDPLLTFWRPDKCPSLDAFPRPVHQEVAMELVEDLQLLLVERRKPQFSGRIKDEALRVDSKLYLQRHGLTLRIRLAGGQVKTLCQSSST